MNARNGVSIRKTWWLFLIVAAPPLSWFNESSAASSMQSYVSEVDGSTQQYGLYLPEPFDPNVPHPVVIHLHGYTGRANANFSDYPLSYTNANGWILVKPDGRGNTFYTGVGENDVFRVLDGLRAMFRIDESRIYLTGCSMGGMGSFTLGFRHPDVFAAVAPGDGIYDYRLGYKQYWAKASEPDWIEPCHGALFQSFYSLEIAENAKHLNLYLVVDTNDTIVWPESGLRLHARLDELGCPHSYHQIQGAHCSGYSLGAICDFFSQHVNQPNPKDVVLKANQLKYGSAYWVRIDRLEKKLAVDRFAKIEAKITGKDRDKVEVTASDLLQYTLLLRPELVAKDEVSIYTNGELSYAGPVREITVYASLDEYGSVVGWSTDDTLPRGLRKTAQIEGPIGHAFTSKFLLVKGTIGSKAETSQNSFEAERFAAEWNSGMHANISPMTDASITEDDIATSNLILFGTGDSNSIIAQINDLLPIRIGRDRIVAGATVYEGANYGLHMIFPSPLNPERYVVVRHGTIGDSRKMELESLAWFWPDYVVFDTNILPSATVDTALVNFPAWWEKEELFYSPDAWVEANFFDQYWRLDNDEDGLDDIYEKDIIDADPEITRIEDVKPGDDFDGDGQDNLTEYNAGTDGTDPESSFSAISIAPGPVDKANCQISWRVASGRSYQILWADSVGGPWHRIETLEPEDVVDADNIRTWIDKGTDPTMEGKKPGDCTARFYKVAALR